MSDERTAPDADGERSSSTGTSRGLLARARDRDAAAWERVVSLYGPLVLHWCRGWGLPDDDAADVFQDVFQAVAAHLGGFRRGRSGGTFRGWLRAITRNKVSDHFRRRGPVAVGGSEAGYALTQVPEDEPADASASGDPAAAGVVRRALELIRDEFEPRTWEAFWRTAVDGRPPRDVAAELGMTPGAVRVAKSRVLQRLRAELGDPPGDPTPA